VGEEIGGEALCVASMCEVRGVRGGDVRGEEMLMRLVAWQVRSVCSKRCTCVGVHV